MNSAIITIACIVGYFIINGVFIRIFGRKQDSLEEYGVGSRSFGWFLVAFAYIGGWYTGSIYTGFFSNAATLGVFVHYGTIYSVTSLFIMYFMAKPVWVLGKVYNLETQADIIGLRYGSDKFKFAFALLTLFFYSPWLIIEVKTIGYAVYAATYSSVNFNVGLILVSAFVIGYSFLGGSRASAVGGLVQGVTFTVVGILAMYWLIVKTYGGFGDLYDKVEEINSGLLTLGALGGKYWMSTLIVCTLGGFVLPASTVGLYKAESPRAAKKSVLITPIIGTLISFSLYSLGLGLTTFEDFPQDPQSAAFWISDKVGGPVMVGLLGILALAACMSTVSIVINCVSVLIAKDLVGTIHTRADRQSLFKYARMLTIIVGIVAIIIATQEIPNLMFMGLAMYNCSVQAFPALFIGLFWRKANLPGAVLGFVVGCLFALAGDFFPAAIAWAGGWTGGFIGVVLNVVVVLVCGFVFKPCARVDEIFDTVRNYKTVYKKRAA
ncbi:MAG: sodium:solute symporter family protein [Clostridiales Family XIII bacterium]|jgi:SSS family solute:Na+ symporter|nr:sodium:solute symporter family protein [Clostridiales Family XIII bacterium]